MALTCTTTIWPLPLAEQGIKEMESNIGLEDSKLTNFTSNRSYMDWNQEQIDGLRVSSNVLGNIT